MLIDLNIQPADKDICFSITNRAEKVDLEVRVNKLTTGTVSLGAL